LPGGGQLRTLRVAGVDELHGSGNLIPCVEVDLVDEVARAAREHDAVGTLDKVDLVAADRARRKVPLAEQLRIGGMGDGEEAEPGRHFALMAAAEACLDPDDREVAGEGCRRNMADDDVLRTRELVVRQRADEGWVRRLRDVHHPDASPAERLVAATATDVGVVAVAPDVAEVDIPSEIRMTDELEVVE